MVDDVSREIKVLRQRLGFSQSKFAEVFGIPLRTVQSWEQGSRVPPDYVLSLILQFGNLLLSDNN